VQPDNQVRRRIGADEGEQRRARHRRGAVDTGELDRRQRVIAVEIDDLGVGAQLDAVVSFDAVDEVARHGGVEVGSADDDGDGASGVGEEHGGLAGRVAAADDDGGLGALSGFHCGRGVAPAKATVSAFIESLGLRPLDVGELEMARWAEGVGLLLMGLARHGMGSFNIALGVNLTG
jgi:hypothetical protein